MLTEIIKSRSGLNLCSKYAFMPNKLKYCGPSNERTLFDYAASRLVDQGLLELLSRFECLYPYLRGIAKANKIRDPFDRRVVEAYWLGNPLLNNVSMNDLYLNLKDEHHLSKRLPKKYFEEIIYKIPEGAKPHHSFHVMNVLIHTGWKGTKELLPSLEGCMIMVGKVRNIADNFLKIGESEFLQVDIMGLEFIEGKLSFSRRITKKVRFKFFGQSFIDDLKPGDLVSIHWGFVCEKLSLTKAKRLDSWNQYHLNLANLTI